MGPPYSVLVSLSLVLFLSLSLSFFAVSLSLLVSLKPLFLLPLFSVIQKKGGGFLVCCGGACYLPLQGELLRSLGGRDEDRGLVEDLVWCGRGWGAGEGSVGRRSLATGSFPSPAPVLRGGGHWIEHQDPSRWVPRVDP